MTKRVLLAWSSGKDSAWALQTLRAYPDVEIVGLLTTLNGAADRVAMHGVRHDLLNAQAAVTGLPLTTVSLPDPCSNAEYERLMAGAVADALSRGVTHMAFGDLFLQDVRDYRIRQLRDTGIHPIFPIWASSELTPAIARQMIASGIRAIITCVDTQQLDAEFLGREFDEKLVNDLPSSVDPCGERGEFHTFCFSSPAFGASLAVTRGERVVKGQFHFLELTRR